MAEMRTAGLPERPDTMDFARAWEVRILGPEEQSATDEPLHAE
jgi:hypothetical protein